MKKLLILTSLLFLVGCGDDETVEFIQPEPCTTTTEATGVVITCPDGTVSEIPFPADGQDGADGIDGEDGEDAVVYSEVPVPAGQCVEVADGVWVENIQNGRLIDVYMNDQCKDSLGEYCDNVIPSYGRSGRLDDDPHPGSGTTCWADNLLILAHKPGKNDVDLTIKVIDFN